MFVSVEVCLEQIKHYTGKWRLSPGCSRNLARFRDAACPGHVTTGEPRDTRESESGDSTVTGLLTAYVTITRQRSDLSQRVCTDTCSNTNHCTFNIRKQIWPVIV